MTDEIWKRDEIESPCTKVCILHPGAKICVGCLRTGEEIGSWSSLSAARRREIMQELPLREPRLRDAGALPSSRRAGGARRRARDRG